MERKNVVEEKKMIFYLVMGHVLERERGATRYSYPHIVHGLTQLFLQDPRGIRLL